MCNDGVWHCRTEGPWWKRLRIALFGLTDEERRENVETYAKMRARIRGEDNEDDEAILRSLDGING